MNRTSTRSLMLVALAVASVAVRADVTAGPAVNGSTEPAQGFIVAVPPESNASASSSVAEGPRCL
jgi:hypothetical protein